MDSAIYKGRVRHRRYLPKKHEFVYNLYLNWLPEDKIEKDLSMPGVLSSSHWPAMIKYKRRHYLSPHELSLSEACALRIKKDLGFDFQGTVTILTNLQYFGFCYNPVSFYYCYDQQEKLVAIVADINNTPWNERYAYCIDMREKHQATKKFDKDEEFIFSE